jgi:hypothetical protein
MDFAIIALAIGLFALTLGLVRLCDQLIGGGK